MPAAAEEQGWGGERNTLQVFPKASPLKHPVKNGVTQKTRKTEMQGVSNPQILSTFTSVSVQETNHRFSSKIEKTAVPPAATGPCPRDPGIA